jgi:hypothetical protein
VLPVNNHARMALPSISFEKRIRLPPIRDVNQCHQKTYLNKLEICVILNRSQITIRGYRRDVALPFVLRRLDLAGNLGEPRSSQRDHNPGEGVPSNWTAAWDRLSRMNLEEAFNSFYLRHFDPNPALTPGAALVEANRGCLPTNYERAPSRLTKPVVQGGAGYSQAPRCFKCRKQRFAGHKSSSATRWQEPLIATGANGRATGTITAAGYRATVAHLSHGAINEKLGMDQDRTIGGTRCVQQSSVDFSLSRCYP